MENYSFEKLEFYKVLNIISEYAFSYYGRDAILELRPIENCDEELEKVSEMISLLIKEGEPPVGGIFNIKELINLVNDGEIINAEGLLKIRNFMQGINALQNEFDQYKSEYTLIREIVFSMVYEEKIVEAINKTVDEDGLIKDGASDKLRQIRTDIKRNERKMRSTLDKLMHGSLKNHVQQEMYIQRDGRYVIPIKVSSRSQVKGIVHSSSASGATYYMEPEAMLPLNDSSRTLRSEEIEEINRILRKISLMILKNIDQIYSTMEFLTQFDSLWARAKFSIKNGGTVPVINKGCDFKLIDAKHPLIGKNCVPISAEIPEGKKGIVITGPNTGGKTVTLKTIGLSHIMAMSGIPILAAIGSNIGRFEHILADIGDEQSIEQSLSTFSAHLKNVTNIVNISGDKSMILLDELGAGTDPVEGAAIALGLLETLLEMKSTLIVTSHLSPIKLYCFGKKELISASVEFNIETLSPTYKLIQGVAGSSNAFKIAEKLGLPETVLEKADEFLDSEYSNVEEVINSLQHEKAVLQDENKKAKDIRIKLERKMNEYDTRIENIKKKKLEMYLSDIKDFEEELKEIKKQTEQIVGKLRRENSLKLDETKDLNKDISDIYSKKIVELKKSIEVRNRMQDDVDESSIQEIKVNDFVIIRGTDTPIKVIEILKNKVLVEKDGLKFEVNKNKLIKVKAPKLEKKVEQVYFQSAQSVKIHSNQIDLRGKNVDEAIDEVNAFIEYLIVNRRETGYIIHGKGTGRLADSIWSYLARDGRVRNYKVAKPQEGGTGATIISL